MAGCTNQTGPNYTRRTNSDCLHPPCSIRPRGVKRVKSLKGLTPVGRTVLGAPMLRNAVRGFCPFTLFTTGSSFTPPHALTHAREGGDALPYKLPITPEKPPGTSPGGLRYSIAQREVSHCLQAQPGQPRHAAARLFIRDQRVSAADWRAWSSSSPRRLNLPMPRTKSAMGMGFGFVKLR